MGAATQRAAAEQAAAQRAAAEKAAAQRLSASKTSSSNSNGLIANIIATLQPQIGAAVQSAIGTSRSVSSRRPVVQTSSIRAVSAPAVRTSSQTISSNPASSLSSLFGSGGNLVRIATPKFQVEY